ncbi:MAG: hypothetical protein IKY67_03520 [Paludibacteraceae bacterium]|nr:hypothetical protein [Paludibacteraceae bacterium]
MNISEIAQKINLAVKQPNESVVINEEGQKLYLCLQQNINKIKGRNKDSYHLGSAMYFYRNYINKENESTKYKLMTLMAYIKLYESISYQDLQSLFGAYRLHILLVEEKEFFNIRLMRSLISSLDDLFSDNFMEISKKIDKLFYAMQYTLFYYCSDDPGMFRAMDESEKEKFEQIYASFKKEYKICKFENKNTIELGIKTLKFLYETLSKSDLGQFESLGTLA